MQNESTSLYDVPAQALLYTHEGLGAERELGEMEVVSTFFGGAKVRPVRRDGGSGWVWWLVALVAVAGAGAVILLRQSAPEASVAAQQVTTPQVVVPQASAPQVAAPQTLVPQTLVPQTQPTAQAPAQKPAAAGVDKTKAMLEKLATDKPRAKLPVAQPVQQDEDEQADDAPAPVAVSANPVAAQPAMQITKTPPAAKPAPAQSSSEGAKTSTPPAGSEPQPSPTGTQP